MDFKPSYPISILSFLRNFKGACDNNSNNEVIARWPFQFFRKYPAETALPHSVRAAKGDDPQQKGMLIAYCLLDNYMAAKYASDYVIAEFEAVNTKFKQPERRSAVPHR